MHIVVDIDGTLTNEKDDYGTAVYLSRTPRSDVIACINQLYEDGHVITLFTARYSEDEQVTRAWLAMHGVKFTKLLFNKMQYDVWIDDKAINPLIEVGLSTESINTLVRRGKANG